MPNTLAHIGLQVPLTRLGLKKVPLQWILVGCIIPDIPWIVQRILSPLPEMNLVFLKLYATTQASLAYCLILSLALAMLSSNSRRTFLILAANSLLHLLLDAAQIKWGNGIHLLVPFSWQLTNFNLVWPEHFSSYLLSTIGLFILLISWPKAIHDHLNLQWPNRTKTICLIFCILLYFTSPSFLVARAYETDTRYSKTLSQPEARTGKKIALDRGYYSEGEHTVTSYTGEQFKISNPPATDSTTLSIRGKFVDKKTIELSEFHIHNSFRNLASYAGLLLTLLIWIHSCIPDKFHRNIYRSSP